MSTRKCPNVSLQDVVFMFHIREVNGPDLGQEADYTDGDLSWFSSNPPGKCRNIIVN
jgi:hypothetical protein